MRTGHALLMAAVSAGVWLFCCCASSGHDLKVFASRQKLAQPGKTVAFLSWGHVLPADELIDAKSLEQYELRLPDGGSRRLPLQELGFQECEVDCQQLGLYQIAAVRRPGTFTFVFDESGRRVMRRGNKKEVAAGKIDYAMRSYQFAKAYVLCGEVNEKPSPLGHILELVPIDSPKHWSTQIPLRLQLLFRGSPLAGEVVTATYVGYHPEDAWCFAKETDREGLVHVSCSTPGTWVFRVRHRRAVSDGERDLLDYEVFTATLTLAISGR